ncbi:SGNH hydrolase [Phellopilus nigrolimitatus]|nr:SGNH hydrolase [Phellopilus nigrolimitatus]
MVLVLRSCTALVLLAMARAMSMTLAGERVIRNDDPLIYYHGRWDTSPGTWWAGSGFKLNVQNLTSLTLNLGNHTTSPLVSIGVSLDYGSFFTVNVSVGENTIPLNPLESGLVTIQKKNTVVRINAEEWQDNRVNLESIVLNSGADLLPYTPSKLAFQFIGDSLSAGQYLPQGVDQAWPFLTSENFKAEHVVVAQPGAALTDIVSYGNEHGMSYQFFRTEDTGYFYTTDHNYTTPWDFKRDVPAPDVVVIHIGANDSGQNVPADEFVQNYLNFLAHLRKIYVVQPILLFTPWGWPQPDGSISYYYQGKYEEILSLWRSFGDDNTYLVNTTGWVSLEDVFPDNLHPTVAGHEKIAGLFETWLKDFGIEPQESWATT